MILSQIAQTDGSISENGAECQKFRKEEHVLPVKKLMPRTPTAALVV